MNTEKTAVRISKHAGKVAAITIMAIMMSCVFFYYEDDINYAVSGMEAPALKKLTYTQSGKKYKAELTWSAKKGRVYEVLRKTSSGGKYKVLARVKTSSASGKYSDKNIGKNKKYTYTVRRVMLKGSKVTDTGKYDAAGLTTIPVLKVTVDHTNMKAGISWKKIKGVSRYLIYRKTGRSDKFYKIKEVASGKKSYDDYYYYASYADKNKAFSSGLAALISVRLRNHFMDASNDPLSYKVQGYYSKKVRLVKKESYGLMPDEGDFRLEAPSIVSLTDDGVITWGTVANAEWYRIYRSTDGKKWTKVKDQKHAGKDYIPSTGAVRSDIYQSYKIGGFDRDSYYTVRAFADRNGSTVSSGYDKEFTIRNRKYDEKVLLVGDSISFGSPYYELEQGSFTYQNRISELTGVSFFNPSIPGATYHYGTKDGAEAEEETDTSTSKLVTGVMQMMVKGENTDKFLSTGAGANSSHLYDYDVVMLAGGTNDYLHFDKNTFGFGSDEIDWEKIDDSGRTRDLTFTLNAGTDFARKYTESFDYNIKTFDGAYNQMLKWIEEASIYRVQRGMKPIRVVPMSMFYSDRTNLKVNGVSHYPLTNRNKTANSIGYTLKDYQAELDSLNARWKEVAAFDLYQYDTQAAGILNEKTCPYVTADNLHLTKYSYARYGNSLSSFMMDNFLGKESKTDPDSEAFIARAAKYRLLSERMRYLEELSAEAEMRVYVKLLYGYGLLGQMLDECEPEERERYEAFIGSFDLTGDDESVSEADNGIHTESEDGGEESAEAPAPEREASVDAEEESSATEPEAEYAEDSSNAVYDADTESGYTADPVSEDISE